MRDRYDAIILGGGHNGLVCGSYLARAGLNSVVLERRSVIGGAAVTEEIIPGFRFSVFSYLMSLLHPKVIADFDLRNHGFEVLPATDMFGPIHGGNYIVFSDSIEKTQKSFARFSPKDAAIYPEFDRYLMESVVILRKLLLETPPDPSCRDWNSFISDSIGRAADRRAAPLLSLPALPARMVPSAFWLSGESLSKRTPMPGMTPARV